MIYHSLRTADDRPVSTTKARIRQLEGGLHFYHLDYSHYPDELLVLVEQQYVPADALLDAWGSPFAYFEEGGWPVINSFGPNRLDEWEWVGDDISSMDTEYMCEKYDECPLISEKLLARLKILAAIAPLIVALGVVLRRMRWL
jgi:hypothetical protein